MPTRRGWVLSSTPFFAVKSTLIFPTGKAFDLTRRYLFGLLIGRPSALAAFFSIPLAKIPVLKAMEEERRSRPAPRDTAGVILQILEWKGGRGKTVEDRIERILRLQNIPKEK